MQKLAAPTAEPPPLCAKRKTKKGSRPAEDKPHISRKKALAHRILPEQNKCVANETEEKSEFRNPAVKDPRWLRNEQEFNKQINGSAFLLNHSKEQKYQLDLQVFRIITI